MNCTLPGSSVHGILQARMLAWIAMPSLGGIFLTTITIRIQNGATLLKTLAVRLVRPILSVACTPTSDLPAKL